VRRWCRWKLAWGTWSQRDGVCRHRKTGGAHPLRDMNIETSATCGMVMTSLTEMRSSGWWSPRLELGGQLRLHLCSRYLPMVFRCPDPSPYKYTTCSIYTRLVRRGVVGRDRDNAYTILPWAIQYPHS
jgi:hypothetical protein